MNKIALSYERVDKCAKHYKFTGGGLHTAPVGALQINYMQLLRKTGHYERKCRGKRSANRGCVGLSHGETDEYDQFAEHDDVSSQHDTSVGWVNNRPSQNHGWDSDSSEDYTVTSMSSRERRRSANLK